MKNEEYLQIENMLYDEDTKSVISKINSMNDSIKLHIFASNYNWNNGFKIPFAIVNNKKCDLGTALLLFYNADGYELLNDSINLETVRNKDWLTFLDNLYHRIQNLDFDDKKIEYEIPLSKVQLFKIKKKNKEIPDILLEGTKGVKIKISNL